METIKNVCLGLVHGLWDSISGMSLILHIDNEIHKLNVAQELEKQRMQRNHRRTPSPVPSSASAMARDNTLPEDLLKQFENETDERSLDSLRKKSTTSKDGKPKPEKKIAKQVLKCCLLNGGFTWLSIILFEQLLLPTLKMIITWCYGENSEDLPMTWHWVQSVLSIVFGMMWVLPMFLLSKIVSSLWFADIANAAYRVRKGKPQMIPNVSKLVADFLFSLVVQALFLVQSMLVNLVPLPYVGSSMCFVHLCLLYSLYCFEYKWFNMGWELHRRLTYIETNWSYFIGFGIPLTVLTNMSNSVIVSSCIFSIFFPLFILSGNEAKPLVGTTETPLRLFSPVIFFSNLFFNRGRKRTAAAARMPNAALKLTQQQLLQHEQMLLRKEQMEHDSLRRSKHHQYTERRSSSSSSRQRQPQQQQQQYQQQQQQQQTYRYRQPPLPMHLRSPTEIAATAATTTRAPRPSVNFRASPLRDTSPGGGHYSGGMRPLIPTKVPGAPQPPGRNR